MTIEDLLKYVDNRNEAKRAVKIAYTSKMDFALSELREVVDMRYGNGTFQEAIDEYNKANKK